MQTQADKEQTTQYVQAALTGDHQAFAELVRMHEPMLQAFALYRLPYKEEAIEAVQDTFVRAFEQLASFRMDSDFATWLRSICRFMILTRVKKYIRRKARHDDYKEQLRLLSVQHLSASTAFIESEVDPLLQLTRCRQQLSDTNQTLLRDRYEASLSIQNISEKTGRTETWVTSTLHRVRNALRTCIEKRMKEQSDEK